MTAIKKTEVAEGVPFDSEEFNSDNVQDAIIEAKQNAEGFPRAGIPLIYNGTVSNNDLISYSNLTSNTPIVFPVNTKLNEVSFSNDRASIECDLEFWRGGVSSGVLVKTISVSTGAGGFSQVFDLNVDDITFNASEILQIRYIDQGTNARDMALVLWISRIP